MNPLIIVSTPNTCWLHPGTDYPKTPEAIAKEAALCRENGSAVLHIHGEGQWKAVFDAIRNATDIIIQGGMSSITMQERIELFEEKADMCSIIANHHAEAFVELNCDVLHPLSELEEYAVGCRKYGVKPEFEIWHTGSIWNLNELIKKNLLDAPYITTLFFDWPGGTWSPPTVEEYLYRRRMMPDNCAVTVSIMGEKQMDILVAAITHGDNVRVGTEDYPFNKQGQKVPTHMLVKEIADIARSLGREIATPAQARKLLGL